MIRRLWTLCIASVLALAACGEAVPSYATGEVRQSVVQAHSSEAVRIVGSTTVYPFSIKVAEELRNKTGTNTVVESTGSGGGHKLFCAGFRSGIPDIVISSRPQKSSESEACLKNGIGQVIEIKIGYDGIVLANALQAPQLDLSLQDIYLALAKDVPIGEEDCTLRPNPYRKWSDIRQDLPDFAIAAYGPPPTSGTRDAFVDIAMEAGAGQIACLSSLKRRAPQQFAKAVHTLREDGKWIDAGENDNAIVLTLTNTPGAIGVFGYSFLDQNENLIKGASISGVMPGAEAISTGRYALSRPLFFYLKINNAKIDPRIKAYAMEFTSEEAWGPDGYLEEAGLVTLSHEERLQYRAAVDGIMTD